MPSQGRSGSQGGSYEILSPLKEKLEELARSNSELEMFASAASHDLQEPLRKIIAFGNLLEKHLGAGLDPTAKHFLHRIRSSAGRMSELIQSLLKLSQVTRDRRALIPADLNQALMEALDDLQAPLAEAKGSVIRETPLPVLEAHPAQMRQLFANLIANALKFARPEEPAMIRISWSAPEVGFAEITVTDNGIGIEEKNLERIFHPFVRLHGGDRYPGHGIGLALCRRIALRHGGWISAQSRPGHGSIFRVTLPMRRSA
ncbi:MAG: hypothetical protein HY921_08545 [Elusimicrobia bacterium]|nr:hypothetical protein [Elusimicrobiota bacterium]